MSGYTDEEKFGKVVDLWIQKMIGSEGFQNGAWGLMSPWDSKSMIQI